jgi:predicted nucleic acid-binding protein
MSGSREFVDTNVLVYAHHRPGHAKRETARELVARLWRTETGCISVQVLQEFFVTVTRKIPKPLDATTAAQLTAHLARWPVHAPQAEDVLAAIALHQRAGIALWDAMIIRSAAQMECQVVWSEDLNPGQIYAGVVVRNPFTT